DPSEGTSSTGRASVSKTEGWGFKSFVPCKSRDDLSRKQHPGHTTHRVPNGGHRVGRQGSRAWGEGHHPHEPGDIPAAGHCRTAQGRLADAEAARHLLHRGDGLR